jgi:hypothetical protein
VITEENGRRRENQCVIERNKWTNKRRAWRESGVGFSAWGRKPMDMEMIELIEALSNDMGMDKTAEDEDGDGVYWDELSTNEKNKILAGMNAEDRATFLKDVGA